MTALVFLCLTCGFRYAVFAGGVDCARIDDRAIGTIHTDAQRTISSDGANVLIGAGIENLPIARRGEDRRLLVAIAAERLYRCPFGRMHWCSCNGCLRRLLCRLRHLARRSTCGCCATIATTGSDGDRDNERDEDYESHAADSK